MTYGYCTELGCRKEMKWFTLGEPYCCCHFPKKEKLRISKFEFSHLYSFSSCIPCTTKTSTNSSCLWFWAPRKAFSKCTNGDCCREAKLLTLGKQYCDDHVPAVVPVLAHPRVLCGLKTCLKIRSRSPFCKDHGGETAATCLEPTCQTIGSFIRCPHDEYDRIVDGLPAGKRACKVHEKPLGMVRRQPPLPDFDEIPAGFECKVPRHLTASDWEAMEKVFFQKWMETYMNQIEQGKQPLGKNVKNEEDVRDYLSQKFAEVKNTCELYSTAIVPILGRRKEKPRQKGELGAFMLMLPITKKGLDRGLSVHGDALSLFDKGPVRDAALQEIENGVSCYMILQAATIIDAELETMLKMMWMVPRLVRTNKKYSVVFSSRRCSLDTVEYLLKRQDLVADYWPKKTKEHSFNDSTWFVIKSHRFEISEIERKRNGKRKKRQKKTSKHLKNRKVPAVATTENNNHETEIENDSVCLEETRQQPKNSFEGKLSAIATANNNHELEIENDSVWLEETPQQLKDSNLSALETTKNKVQELDSYEKESVCLEETSQRVNKNRIDRKVSAVETTDIVQELEVYENDSVCLEETHQQVKDSSLDCMLSIVATTENMVQEEETNESYSVCSEGTPQEVANNSLDRKLPAQETANDMVQEGEIDESDPFLLEIAKILAVNSES